MEFRRHFSRNDVERLFGDGFRLPEGFLFGVANAGFQVEGGFNGPGEPLNNWFELERAGKVETSGEATRFWTDYPDEVELAKEMGLNAFRLGVEWSRVQPGTSAGNGDVPPFDASAIEAYSDMIAEFMGAGMEPMVTLHHFVHPYWLGLDFWLHPEKLGLFQAFVEEIARRLNTFLVEKHGRRPVKYWITINEPNGLAFGTFMLGVFPHHKSGLRRSMLAWGNLIDAHCRAYDTLHRVYEENGWEKPRVSYNTIHFANYGVDKIMTDILNARRNDIERADVQAYLDDGRERWDAEIARCPEVERAPWLSRAAEKIASDLVLRLLTAERLKNGVDAVYSSPLPDKLDYLAVDFYDPFLRNMLKAPSIQDVREKRLNFNAEHWEWVLNPVAMYHFLKAETINSRGLPVLIVENGMCNKVYRGRVEARRDGATRDVFLQAFVYEAMRALKDGVPLEGYFYWTMVDNYEWGSFDPRFGLFTVDRSREARRSSVDAWGTNAAAAYGVIISALRSGEVPCIADAFTRGDF